MAAGNTKRESFWGSGLNTKMILLSCSGTLVKKEYFIAGLIRLRTVCPARRPGAACLSSKAAWVRARPIARDAGAAQASSK